MAYRRREVLRRGYQTYEGKHLRLEDAPVFDLPEEPPVIAVASAGPAASRIAAELGDGPFATEPKDELVRAYRDAGGSGLPPTGNDCFLASISCRSPADKRRMCCKVGDLNYKFIVKYGGESQSMTTRYNLLT